MRGRWKRFIVPLYLFVDHLYIDAVFVKLWHHNNVIMSAIASQITSLTIVYSTVYSDADQRIHQSSASLAFVRGIHRGPLNFPHKRPVTRKMFTFDDVIMNKLEPISRKAWGIDESTFILSAKFRKTLANIKGGSWLMISWHDFMSPSCGDIWQIRKWYFNDEWYKDKTWKQKRRKRSLF